jgi:hypothetical protein
VFENIHIQEGGGRCWQKVSDDDDSKVNKKGKVGKGDGNGNDSNYISLVDGNETNNNLKQFIKKIFHLAIYIPQDVLLYVFGRW